MPYLAPPNAEEAFRFLDRNKPKIIAGCTDYFPSLQQGETHQDLLDITRISGLRGITKTDRGWRIGAATTWTDVVRADLPGAFDALKLAAVEVGSLQIQNQGTVAGNICNASPAADGVPPLLVLDAGVEIGSLRGSRTVPLSEFIQGVRKVDLEPGEMVVAIHVPDIADAAASSFSKLGGREYLVISIAMIAAVVQIQDGHLTDLRVAIGSCSPVAQRLPDLEALLKGQKIADLIEMDFKAEMTFAPLSPISDVRGSAEYRLDVVTEMCRRVILQACKGD